MGVLDRLWAGISESLFGAASGPDSAGAERARERAEASALVVWLLGKTGAGKTAIVAALTGDPRAEVGLGFEPCTRTASFYDVPPEAPLLRFLDTRGLGEVNYDPANDISWCEQQAHLMLVVMQVQDPNQQAVLDVLREARRRHSDWPVVVAQTGLHRLYPAGMSHPVPYPYTGGPDDETQSLLPHPLRRALAYQRTLFKGLRGRPPRFVPIDFTVPEDGFVPQDYGLEMLWRALEETGLVAFDALHRARAEGESDRVRAKARPLIYGCGAAAAGAGAVPIPIVGVGGLAGVIAMMLQALASRYGAAWTPRTFAEFSSAVGGGTLAWWMLRYGVRELLKLIPIAGSVAAGALNAAAGFAVTVAIGEAACVWLDYHRRGLNAPSAEVRRAFADGLAAGLRRTKRQAAKPERPT
ncbi:MAG: GTPase family protein [Xanthobacteraceae bacterium]